jgi:hypothetical protein
MANRYAFVFPPEPIAGVSGICVPEERIDEVAQLEADPKIRLWTVRAIISDHVPLYGELENVIRRQPEHSLLLNQNPLTIYVSLNGSAMSLACVPFPFENGRMKTILW